MPLRKFIFSLLLLLPAACAMPQKEATFQSFLNELKECNKVELSCFGDVSALDDPFIDKEQYKQFLPEVHLTSLKNGFQWVKGSYIKHGNLVIAMLGIYCGEYDDIYKYYFVEHDAYTYMLVTYSPQGKIMQYEELGMKGGGAEADTYFTRITPTDNPLKFRVESGLLFDPTLLDQYKDLEYVVQTHEFTISPNGEIEDWIIGTPRKEYVKAQGADSHKIVDFGQFKSYFVKCGKPYTNDSLFVNEERQEDLPVPDCFDFFPDTVISFAWPRYADFTPCRYIEAKGSYFFFIIEHSSQPFGVYPYNYFKILEFDGNGRFKRVVPVFFHGDCSYGRAADDIPISKLIGELKKYEHLWNEPQ